MKITLNGDPYSIPGPLSVDELLAQLNINPQGVAIEHNLVVVKHRAYGSTLVTEGDEVEIVNFVGGGQ